MQISRETRFVLNLTVIVQLLRFIGTLVVILIPNTLNANDLVGLLNVWDGHYYLWIAVHGYLNANGQFDEMLVNFSPLYPILIRWLGYAVTPYVAPYILNTVFTSLIPWLAWKLAEKMVLLPGEKQAAEVEWRRRLIVIGITLNPIFLGYSIFNLTEPLFYMLLLGVLNCNQREGRPYVALELVLLYLLGMAKFVAVVICAFYLYQVLFQDIAHQKSKQMLRHFACVVVSFATFLLWDFIIPVTLYGISASGATVKYWGVQLGFSPNSPFFVLKIGIVATAVIGGLFVLRLLAIRENWTLFGFRDQYLQQLKKDGLIAPAAPNELRQIDISTVDKANIYNFEFIEAFAMYGFAVFFAQGSMDPLYCFYRYVSVIIPFFACMAISTRRTKYIPVIMCLAIAASIFSNFGIILVLLVLVLNPALPRTILPSGLADYMTLLPNFIAEFVIISVAFILFIYYFICLPSYKDGDKTPNIRKIALILAIVSLLLMYINLYIA
ncbi:MAG TPA: hypothetical protein VKK79_10410 [Candidatus Lokiarchaeia archaeon]|nr:hypothetical protein [Candidatus Lokiarchaeia archaeon]